MRSPKIAYLDGLRGIAAFIVLLTHFTATFYPGIAFNDPARAHIPHQLESRIALSPLNLFFSGELAVCVFFVLSGYVLSVGFFARPNRQALTASFAKRYVRLEIPILFAVLVGWLLLTFGLCANVTIIPITKSEWLGLFFRTQPNLLHALRYAFVDVFVAGTYDYDPVLWTMKVELLGSYLVYALLLVFGASSLRFLAYPVAIGLLSHSYYALFVVGMLLASLRPWTAQSSERPALKALGWGFFIVGMIVQSYPYGYPATAAWYEYWGIFHGLDDDVYPRVAAPIILAAVVLVPRLQTLLSGRVPRYLGRVSFSLYLLHFPILASWSCSLFLSIFPHASYNACAMITLFSTVGVVLLAAAAMTRYVDEPAIRLSHVVETRTIELARRAIGRFHRKPELAVPETRLRRSS